MWDGQMNGREDGWTLDKHTQLQNARLHLKTRYESKAKLFCLSLQLDSANSLWRHEQAPGNLSEQMETTSSKHLTIRPGDTAPSRKIVSQAKG